MQSDLVYDPDRKAPEKPLALQTFLLKHRRGDRTSKEYDCPHCDGEGDYFEEEGSQHRVACEECSGTGVMAFTFIRDYYFRSFQKYLADYREWLSYIRMLGNIRRKLNSRERRFVGFTNEIKSPRRVAKEK